MFAPKQVIFFRQFYFKDGSPCKSKYFIVLASVENAAIIATLPTSRNWIPGIIQETHGCINIEERCINCYVFKPGKKICDNGFSFPLPTYIYGQHVEDYTNETLRQHYN